MSLIKNIFFGIILLIGVLIFLIGTTSGLHLLLNSVSRLVPGLDMASINGNWHNLTIKQLRYQVPGLTIVVSEFHLKLDFNCLRKRQLCINDLSLHDVMIGMNITKLSLSALKNSKKSDVSIFRLPYPLILRRLALNKVQVKFNNTFIVLDKFITGFHFDRNNLTIMPTRIIGLLVSLPTTIQLITDSRHTVAKSLKLSIHSIVQKYIDEEKSQTVVYNEPSLAETLRIFFAKPLLPLLPSFISPLNLRLTNVDGENLQVTGDSNLFIDHLRLQALIQDKYAQLILLNINSSKGLVNATGYVELDGRWPVNMTINTILNNSVVKDENIKLIVEGELYGELRGTINLSGPLTAQLDLKTRLAQIGLPVKLTFKSQSLKWPLIGTSQYQAHDLTLRLEGEAKNYKLALTAAFNCEGLPPANVTMNIKGNTDGFTLLSLRLAALQGYTNLNAVVNWKRAISWRSELLLSGINIARQWPNWPSRLDGKIISRGNLYGGIWQLQIFNLDLRGQIYQDVLIAKGSLRGNTLGQWQVPKLLLTLGRNQLIIKGELNDTFTLNIAINAPKLNGALFGLNNQTAGNINLKLHGNFKKPQLLIDFDANSLYFGRTSIERIVLQGSVYYNEIMRGDIQLRLDRFQKDRFSISQLILDANGDEKHHKVKVRMQGDPVAGQLQLIGTFNRQKQYWHGLISQTRLDTSVGEWHLIRTISLDYLGKTKNLIIGSHCWQNTNAQICIPKNIELGDSGQVKILLLHLNLAILKLILPPETQINGTFSGLADISWTTGIRLLQGKVELLSNRIQVIQTIQGKKLPIDIKTVTFKAVLDRGLVRLGWLIKIANNGQFKAQVKIIDLKNRRNLSGNINISNLSLALLNPIFSQSESINGLINTTLRLGGDVQSPRIYGQLDLEHLLIKGNFMPFIMNKSRLIFFFTGNCSILHGFINTTHGKINLFGNADWSKMNSLFARINANADNLRIAIPPMLQLDISPNISLEAMPKLLVLNGKVDIPLGHIEIQDMPQSVISVSSDEVLLNDKLQPIIDRTSFGMIPFYSNLLFQIGPNVDLNAFGLKAKLKGNIKFVKDKQVIGINGQINIPSGRFHAYGQDLIINKGEILFSGPIDQTYLNIEAIRNPDSIEKDITAGIRISGLADQPKIEVFSNPVKSQQEALSYLLSGQGLNASGVDSTMITSMLIGMGVTQSGKIIDKIGQIFGIKELAINTQGTGDSSKLVVSGYIAPGLQVKYGVGIFDSLVTLTLRYCLMPKLYLEAVSGLNQAIELLYQLEF